MLLRRRLTLGGLSAAVDGVTLNLLNAKGEAQSFDRDVTEYWTRVDVSARTLDFTASFRSLPTETNPNSGGYLADINGTTYAEAPSAALTLDPEKTAEDVTVTVHHADAAALPATYTLHVQKTEPTIVTFVTEPKDATVFLTNEQSGRRAERATDGSFALTPGDRYTYTVTAKGYVGTTIQHYTAPEQAETVRVTLQKAAENTGLQQLPAQWPSFRADAYNNGVIDARTPVSSENTVLYWATQLGSGYSSDACGCPIIVDDCLYTYGGETIYKLDKRTGEVLAQGKMDHKSSFAINSPTYAEGMIFVGLANGCVQAFDAVTLESLWLYEDPLGGQPNCPITYEDGYLYTGFWNREDGNANFVCLTVTDEDPAKTDESKLASWTYTSRGKFYWAGAYAYKDFVLVGTDDGEAGYTTGHARVLSFELVGKAEYRRRLVCGQSARLVCGYVYANAGEGESTTDLVFNGHNIVAENGALLAERRFATGLTVSEVDVERLDYERRRLTTFRSNADSRVITVPFALEPCTTTLTRHVNPLPFVPEDGAECSEHCDEIILLAALGLKKRMEHSGAQAAVVGLSGGLDSTLAILITSVAMRMMDRPASDMIAVTMPCFGTTERTRDNAVELAERLGATLRRIDIGAAVRQHFKDIGQSMDDHDVTFENSQARERTQVLMDVANQCGGLVVGTGDLSELALGWATYNGDHMSMYSVNASIPKTLVRRLVSYVAGDKAEEDEALSHVLSDILDTPVSPELLPAIEGQIAQKTEDLVGPYELHDFFLYYAIRWAFPPRKVLRLAEHAFGRTYPRAVVLQWLRTFYRRFFAQQFKRSCLPDGPKVGSVSLSPRGDWRMPSDAVAALWLEELEGLEGLE